MGLTIKDIPTPRPAPPNAPPPPRAGRIAPPEGYAIVPVESRTGIAIDEGFIPAKYRAKESL